MKKNLCKRCGNEIARDQGYGSIHIGRGATPYEQLHSMRDFRLCDGCVEPLLAWLGIQPEPPPPPEPKAEPPMPRPPVGCNSAYT